MYVQHSNSLSQPLQCLYKNIILWRGEYIVDTRHYIMAAGSTSRESAGLSVIIIVCVEKKCAYASLGRPNSIVLSTYITRSFHIQK